MILSLAFTIGRKKAPGRTRIGRLAARGHYFVKKEPLRAASIPKDAFYQPPIPSVKEGEYSLSFARGEGNDFSLLLSFPGPRGPIGLKSRCPTSFSITAALG